MQSKDLNEAGNKIFIAMFFMEVFNYADLSWWSTCNVLGLKFLSPFKKETIFKLIDHLRLSI